MALMSEPLRFEVARYEREKHAAFVASTYCFHLSAGRQAKNAIDSRLRRPDTRCFVAHSPVDPDLYLGCVVVTGRLEVVWAFTRERCRRKGLMTSLLLLAGVDVSQPVPCLNWSDDMAAVAASDGYRVFYAPSGRREARAS